MNTKPLITIAEGAGLLDSPAHGGKRQGSGRKPKPASEKRRVVSYSLPPTAIARLNSEAERRGCSQSELIEALINALPNS